MRAVLPAALLAVLFLSFPAMASAGDDRDRAGEAAAAGRILPLSRIVERAIAQFGGTVLDAAYEAGDDDEEEEEEGHGGPRPHRGLYRVKLLTTDGRILKLAYDAASGELIGQRGRHRERHRGGRGDGKDD
jgi:uncharacterized membrane protein YkoI